MPSEKVIKCPFCDKGDVRCMYTPMTFTRTKEYYGTNTSTVTRKQEEKYEPIEDCPECKKSKSKIQKSLRDSASKRPSREDVLRRMKESGLNTTITNKRK